MKTICVSGGMDPITSGHVDMIEHAATFGNVIVILNSDNWLIRKKGYCFMPYEQRKRILASIKGVWCVEPVDDSDGSVREALRRIKPDCFANGGDRTEDNTLEVDTCRELDIKMIFNVGGDKSASSSELVKNAAKKLAYEQR